MRRSSDALPRNGTLSRRCRTVYAARDETRHENLQELLARLRQVHLSRQHYRALAELLLPVAMQTTQGIVLAHTAVDELRHQHVLLPPLPSLEKLCAALTTRAQREVHRLLMAPLPMSNSRRSTNSLPLTDCPVSMQPGYGDRRANPAQKLFSQISAA